MAFDHANDRVRSLLEPIVSLVFDGLALLGVLVTLFYNAIRMPHFPTRTMLALSIGFGLVARNLPRLNPDTGAVTAPMTGTVSPSL